MPRTYSRAWPEDSWDAEVFILRCLEEDPSASAGEIARRWGEAKQSNPLPERNTRKVVARLKARPGPDWLDQVQARVREEAIREYRTRHNGNPATGRSAWELLGLARPRGGDLLC